MDQIEPRVLIEYGCCDVELLANWMVWRKWIYDIDNRSAQETGYLFEPVLASCLGGEGMGAKNSPIKRLDAAGNPTPNGRQIDSIESVNVSDIRSLTLHWDNDRIVISNNENSHSIDRL